MKSFDASENEYSGALRRDARKGVGRDCPEAVGRVARYRNMAPFYELEATTEVQPQGSLSAAPEKMLHP